MLQPSSLDGAAAGTSIATLLHVPVVPARIMSGPSHDVTYDELCLAFGVFEVLER